MALTLTYDLPFRFLAGFTACIELIHIVWDLDFVFLFNLLEQPVLRGHEKVTESCFMTESLCRSERLFTVADFSVGDYFVRKTMRTVTETSH